MDAIRVVPAASILFCMVSLFLAVGFPLVLVIRNRKRMNAILAGVFGFSLGAIVLESLFHQFMIAQFPAIFESAAAYTVYGCLTAGVFEETARFVALKYLCKKDPCLANGLCYGIGHGAVEALYVVGSTLLGQLSLMIMINAGSTADLLANYTEDQIPLVEAQLDALCATDSGLFLASGVERVAAICFHIALSLVIWMVVTKKLPLWGYPVAILLHAGLNVSAALYQTGVITNVWLVEAAVAVFTALTCFGVYKVLKSKGLGEELLALLK